MARDTLTSQDWIKAAFRALSAGGPQAIRAEAIARDLKVSKGSFYWHFADVPALKAEMLAYWQHHATDAIAAAAEAVPGSSRDKLRALIAQASTPPPDVGGVAAEPAIFDWARYDANAARAVQAVNEQRLAYLVTTFTNAGQDPAIATQNATLFYAALLGLNRLPGDMGANLTALLDHLLPRAREPLP